VGHHTDLYAPHFHRNRGLCVLRLRPFTPQWARNLRELPLLERKARLEMLIVANSDDRCELWRSVDSSRHDRAASREPRRRVRSSRAWRPAIAVSTNCSVNGYPPRNGLSAAVRDEKFRRCSNQFAVCRGSRAAATLSAPAPPSLHEPDIAVFHGLEATHPRC
jgi:hypothetical protein